MNNNSSLKQWVAMCHMDVLIKLKLVALLRKTLLYSIQEIKHHILTIIKTTK
jgi:hypothetical protein